MQILSTCRDNGQCAGLYRKDKNGGNTK